MSESEKALHIGRGYMTHEQVGQILALANWAGAKRYEAALRWLELCRAKKSAEDYINALINEVDNPKKSES